MVTPAEQMTLLDIVQLLRKLSKPVINDRRQNKYCEYISLLLSHFGNERCMVAGSTQEGTRLRLREDEGDFDYLLISEFSVLDSAIEYHHDVPCFVHINCEKLSGKLPFVELVEGKYLPSYLLSEVRPEVFNHLRDIFKMVTKPGTRRGRNTLRIIIDKRIKPGISLGNYANVECTDMCISLTEPKTDGKEILSKIRNHIKNEPTAVQNQILSALCTITNVGLVYKYLVSDGTELRKSNLLQNYGPIINAIERQQKRMHNANEEESENISQASISHTRGNSEKKNEFVLLKYKYKTFKDFIPAFPLKGTPHFLNVWKHRTRNSNWPPRSSLEKIYNGEIFIVAKPAIHKSSKDKDFCLGFNTAENELAKVMTETQKNVLLIVKALQKNALKTNAEILTTFHWKTALYWVSERVDSKLLDKFEFENTEKLLDELLSFMVECLNKCFLEHYFIDSNLFAGKDRRVLNEIKSVVERIMRNPLKALQNFVDFQRKERIEVEWVPRSKIVECNNIYNDKSASAAVDDVICLLQRFMKEDPKILKRAIRNVLKQAIPFIVEEEMRGRKETRTSALIVYILSFACFRNLLINLLLQYINFDKKWFAIKYSLIGILLMVLQSFLTQFFAAPSLMTMAFGFGILKLCQLFL